MTRCSSLVLVLSLVFPSSIPVGAAAQQVPGMPPDSGPRMWDEARALDVSRDVVLRSTWTARGRDGLRRGELSLSIRPAAASEGDLGPADVTRTPLSLHRGDAPRACLATNGNSVLVAVVTNGARPAASAIVVDVARGRAPRIVSRQSLSRSDVPEGHRPIGIVCAPEPDGFAVLWQEQGGEDATAVTTVLAHVRAGARDGARGAQPTTSVVQVPWGVLAMAWNGHGYHLALAFGGWGEALEEGHERICLVTLDPRGVPEQHPWWISPMAAIDEVQVMMIGTAAHVTWRQGERAIVEHVSQGVGAWGREPPAPQTLGELEAGRAYVVRDEGGTVRMTPAS